MGLINAQKMETAVNLYIKNNLIKPPPLTFETPKEGGFQMPLWQSEREYYVLNECFSHCIAEFALCPIFSSSFVSFNRVLDIRVEIIVPTYIKPLV